MGVPGLGAGKDDALLAALYASVTHDDAFSTMLGLLSERFGCVSAVIAYVDPLRPEADILIGQGVIDEAVIRRYQSDFATLDPAPAAMSRMPIGTAATTEKLLGGESDKHARFLSEFYHPLGLVEALGGPVVNSDGRLGIVAVQRGPDRPPFDDDDISDFERLMPHMTQAVELRRAFFAIQSETTLLKSAMDSTAAGILIVSPSGRLTTANLVARDILDRRDGLQVDRSGRLSASSPAANQALAEAFERLSEDAGSVMIQVPRRQGPATYSLRISRNAEPTPLSPETRQGFVVVIHDPAHEVTDIRRILAEAFRLTPSGAALVAALVEGHDLRSYSGQAGISLNTAKFHLQAAFHATGTRRQADLVRRASALVRDMGRPGPAR